MAISKIGSDALAAGVPSRSQLPAGTVLQVVESAQSTNFSTTSSTFVDTGFYGTITPTAASSKILVLYSARSESNTANNWIQIEIRRNGSTTVFNSGATTSSSASVIDVTVAFQFIDSPATTSATTYNVYLRRDSSNTASLVTPGRIILMEIAA